MLDIERAGAADVDAVWKIVKACSDWLTTFGYNHWSKYYTRELVAKKVNDQEVYLKYVDGLPVATVTFDTKPVDYYTKKELNSFEDPKAKALYVRTLAVLPKYQKRGIASELMDFAEEKAGEKGISYVRCDCRALYLDLVNFYRARGCKIVGLIIDVRDNNEPYFLMEKKLGISD